jgi:ABC-type Fe3+-hydroxamate transport system substrate-binding protein
MLNTYSSRTAELRERIGEETTRQLQVSFFRVTGDGSALRVAGVNSFAGSVLADVGFDRPPAQKNSADEELEISLERLDLADGDVLFVGARQDNPDSVRVVEQLKTNPLWLTLSAVKAQRVFDVDSNRWLEGSILNATFILADLERHLSSGITNVPATTTRTVTDDLGRTVDVPARPQRVVALHDLQVLRPLLDLGVTPIASVTHPLAVGAFRFVEEYDVSGIAIIGLLGEPNLEQLTLLKPDMIIGTLSAGTDEQIETLSAIAPTVVYNAGRPVIAYHRLLAEAIGTLDAYDALMADYETRLAELRAGIAPISADLVVSLLAFNPNAGQIQIGEGPYTLIFRGAGIQQPELAPERLEAFAAYRQDVGEVRDLLVCTHGSVDAACSKFGYLTYVHLRKLAADSGGRLRAWRTTHFGGHVFAPTLIDMPHGSYWAYIEQEEAEALVGRSGAVARLREHYRGWAGLPAPFLQVLERELFVRFGWEWLQYAKAGRVLTQDETAEPDDHGHAEPVWAEVHLDYRAPNGVGGSVTARVELTKRVEVIHTSGGTETYAYPQYAVAWLREDEERVQRLLDQAYR